MRGLMFNVRKLGPYWWARCLLMNCFLSLREKAMQLRKALAAL